MDFFREITEILSKFDLTKVFIFFFSGLPVHLDCPCCNNLETYINIGYHLNNLHSATHISCPGKKCGSNLEIPSLAFTDHLMKHHMKINCPTCQKPIGNSQCRNFMIFLSFRFYMKSILEKLKFEFRNAIF